MKYIEKLLQGQKVEWKTLGEVCSVLRGKRLTKKELIEDGEYPVFHGGLIPLGRYDKFNRKANQTMVINTGSVGEVVWSGVDFWSSDGTFVIETNNQVDDKFLYYFLKTKENDFKNQKREGGVPTIERKVIERLQFPLPPLAVQQEIAKILDTFTTLEAELEAELDCRKRQYQYYRDKLLSFNEMGGGKSLIYNDLQWKTLGEVCDVLRGKRLTKRDLIENEKYPVYHGGIEPIGFYNQSNRKANSTMIINVGASAGTIGYSSQDFWSSDGCFCLSHTETVSQRFLFYFLQSIENSIKSKVRKAGIPTLDNRIVEKLQIPLPPLEEQKRIVEILDKFDALVNDISQGLPAEIIARRKQYEYYRERLLNF